MGHAIQNSSSVLTILLKTIVVVLVSILAWVAVSSFLGLIGLY